MRASLANRHVRDNAQNLFEHKLSLSPPGTNDLTAGVRLRGVLRPHGEPAPYNGLNFMERADEPTYTQVSSSNKFADMTLGGGTQDGFGLPKPINPDASQDHGATSYSGDYIEFNRKFDNRLLHFYQGDATYDITGSGDHAVHIDTSRPIGGLLVDVQARDLANKFPSKVVHPDAAELKADDADRQNTLQRITNSFTGEPTGSKVTTADDPV